MHDLFAVGGLLSALGLSSAAGLNATLPLLAIGLLGRSGYLDLADGYVSLGTWPVLAALAAVFVVDVVGDKVPGVDHVLHLVGTVVYPAAGAVAFASQAGVIDHLPSWLALLLGLTTAGSLHAARSAVRPLSTATTAGFGNPVLSTMEDVTSAVLTFLALVAPVLAVLALAVVLVGLWRLWRRVRRRRVVEAAR